jgi:CRISPR system Cascade subunit CasE
MILSRLTLNLRSHAAIRDLADCQQMHRTILNFFPSAGAAPRREFALLFRIECSSIGDPYVIIQSREIPDLGRLPSGYLAKPPEVKDVSEAYAALRPGMKLRFRLRANPTRKIDTKSGPGGERRNGRRVDLRSDEARLGWLARKAAGAGFTILSVKCSTDVSDVRLVPQARSIGYRTDAGGERRKLTFASILFEGVIEMNDPAKFRAALDYGIGSAKAYGFGLLSIAPFDY